MLVNVTSTGISLGGAATLDPSGHMAVILIGPSNDPHGVIEFSETSQPIRVKENGKNLELRIVRRFGKIGTLFLICLTIVKWIVTFLSLGDIVDHN